MVFGCLSAFGAFFKHTRRRTPPSVLFFIAGGIKMEKRSEKKWWERPVAVIISVPENQSEQKRAFVIQSIRREEPSVYEYLVGKRNECMLKARNMHDKNLKRFYLNAAEGFKLKASNISIAEAQA